MYTPRSSSKGDVNELHSDYLHFMAPSNMMVPRKSSYQHASPHHNVVKKSSTKLSTPALIMTSSFNCSNTNVSTIYGNEDKTTINSSPGRANNCLGPPKPLRRCRSATPGTGSPFNKNPAHLTVEAQALIKKSWRRVPKNTLGKVIYLKMVDKHPELKTLLSSDEGCVDRHLKYFINMIQCVVDSCHDMGNALLPWLSLLGSGHSGFAIKAKHWDAFSEALLCAVNQWILSGKDHKETVRAWMKVSCFLADVLGNASRSGAVSNPRLQLLTLLPPSPSSSLHSLPSPSVYHQTSEPIQLKTELSTSPLTKLASLTKHLKQISESKIKTPKQSPHPANPTKDKFSWITHYGVTVHESTGEPTYINHNNQAEDDDKSPKSQDTTSPSGKFLCRICHDNSTGVHYGIFTCEGCKGFFKRTVQNKRVYSCVSGSACCPMTKEQRNRCQFCRFQTCLQQGMVLEAVREDRMPGGRNNSAIYNSYKLKYKKTRKAQTKVKGSERSSIMNNNEDFEDVASINEGSSGINKWMDAAVSPTNTSSSISCSLSPSTITRRLPAAPSVESVCDAESIQRFKATPTCRNLIHEMMEIDSLDTLINLKGLRIASQNALLNQSEEVIPACQRLSRIGDEIVEQLVDWTKNLPFYNDLPVEIHTHLLTQRWAELVLLSACYYAISNCSPISEYTRSEGLLPTNSPLSQSSSSSVTSSAGSPVHFNNILGNRLTEGHDEISFDDVNVNLHLLKERLSKVMHKDIPLEHVVREAGPLVEKFTSLLNSFSKLHITHEAYVCLKAITLLHYAPPTDALALLTEQNEAKNGKTPSSQIKKVSTIQDQFVKALQIHLSQCEDGPRLTDILTWLPMLHSASSVLLHSKMFYVPFLICKSPKSESLVNSESGSDSEA
uniref:Nuclear receptor domain-containing protein n=1 Tax=Rhabditophanes sp. KR3021 TaxID=114890 RepID=A0AC35UE51_9BILA